MSRNCLKARGFSALVIASALFIATVPARAAGGVDVGESIGGDLPSARVIESAANSIGQSLNSESINFTSVEDALSQIKGLGLAPDDPALKRVRVVVQLAARRLMKENVTSESVKAQSEEKRRASLARLMLFSDILSPYLCRNQEAKMLKAAKVYLDSFPSPEAEQAKLKATMDRIAEALGRPRSEAMPDTVSMFIRNNPAIGNEFMRKLRNSARSYQRGKTQVPVGGELSLSKGDQPIVAFILNEALNVAERRRIEEAELEKNRKNEFALGRERVRDDRIRKHLDFALESRGVEAEKVQGRKLVEDSTSSNNTYERNNHPANGLRYDYAQKWVVWTSRKGYEISISRYQLGDKYYPFQSVEEVDLPAGMVKVDPLAASVPDGKATAKKSTNETFEAIVGGIVGLIAGLLGPSALFWVVLVFSLIALLVLFLNSGPRRPR